jgi:hypothetical protein
LPLSEGSGIYLFSGRKRAKKVWSGWQLLTQFQPQLLTGRNACPTGNIATVRRSESACKVSVIPSMKEGVSPESNGIRKTMFSQNDITSTAS